MGAWNWTLVQAEKDPLMSRSATTSPKAGHGAERSLDEAIRERTQRSGGEIPPDGDRRRRMQIATRPPPGPPAQTKLPWTFIDRTA